MAEGFTKRDWIEIAVFALLASLASWLLYHHFHQPSPDQPFADEIEPPATVTPASFPTLGMPPLQLPSATTTNGCGCAAGCAAGQTVSPTIQAIVAQANAALAGMQAMVNGTVQQIASIGNSESGGLLQFVPTSGPVS